MDHGPVPVRTAVQPSLAGQGRPGRNAFSMHFPNESILTEKKRQGKGSFPLALLYWMKNYFFTGVGVATELLPFPSPISCCINKKIPTPRSTPPTLAIPGNT